jgi:hypothetical protein
MGFRQDRESVLYTKKKVQCSMKMQRAVENRNLKNEKELLFSLVHD